MANRRIVCITKHPTHQDRYHRITHVGVGTDADKASEKLDVATVIRNIKSSFGDRYYVMGPDGSEASVIVRKCPHCSNGHDIIATTADNTKRDNLLELRECRWQLALGECQTPALSTLTMMMVRLNRQLMSLCPVATEVWHTTYDPMMCATGDERST